MKNHTLLIVLASLTLALVGCSKHSSGTATNPGVSDLGVVEVSDGVQIQRDLVGGRVCTITPAIQKDGSVLLNLKITQDGKLLAAPRIQTAPDRAAIVAVGDISIGLTPHIKP
jgi:hypothetical protein